MVIPLFLLGICIGSFANVLIDRLPRGKSIVWGRSECDFCHKHLRWHELIPVLSWIIQNGRCRRCHHRLSTQYPFIELVAGVGFVTVYQFIGPRPLLLLALYSIFLSMLVIFVADLKTFIIPDSMVVLGLAGVILYQGYKGNLGDMGYWVSAVAASLLFFILWTVTKGRGMGFGDVKLAFILGLLLGFPGIVVAFYFSFLTGAMIGVLMILIQKKSVRTAIPFGPFLIVGTAFAIRYTDILVTLWRGIL